MIQKLKYVVFMMKQELHVKIVKHNYIVHYLIHNHVIGIQLYLHNNVNKLQILMLIHVN